MRTLYPAIEPYKTYNFPVNSIHTLYVEECGNPGGAPVLFVHGGPGGGCTVNNRRFFDPERFRIVLFDQRGAGRSQPHAELEGNTTRDLVEDIEKIRKHLAIERWAAVFGGSWGSTLSLVYAETYPERVLELILRGIFLCRPREIDWFYRQGANRLFKDYYQEFAEPIPKSERNDIVQAYYRRLTSDDDTTRREAARAWSLWEARCSTLYPSDKTVDFFSSPNVALAISRIECHYFVNRAFLEPDQILRNAGRLADISGLIVQGRYDVVCPMESAWALKQMWPRAELKITPDAGHAASEPGNTHALITATDAIAHR
jgi:proline iminopeptidase